MPIHTVIVGAGAAGCVLAARLTEHSDRPVLLLEAGPDHGTDLPPDLADGTRNSLVDHDWGYRHRPTTRSPLFPMPRGRVVGGSSAVNTCIALRGEPADYDEWAARGLDGWGWDDVLPAFVRLERDLDFADAPYHGSDGPLPVRRFPEEELRPWQRAFLAAAGELGFPECADTNAPGSRGAGRHAMNVLGGRRISAAEAWLTPEVRARPHLTIQDRSTARRLVVRGGRVTGVEVERRGVVSTIVAHRVVLCGGAFGTPGLLLRSGVGPRADVERLGVDLVRDVPAVGAQLLDHPGSAIFFRPTPAADFDPRAPLIQTVLLVGDGPTPALQLQAGSHMPTRWGDGGLQTIMLSVCKPQSVGRLRFTSTDPSATPIIDSRFYDHPADQMLVDRGLALAWELSQTRAMAPLGRCVYPGRTLASRRGLRTAYLPIGTDSGYHPCGTVPMGSATDARGRIDGVAGLRVADASLFPTVPSSNTHLPTLMLAERFGEFLVADPD